VTFSVRDCANASVFSPSQVSAEAAVAEYNMQPCAELDAAAAVAAASAQ
jgi:hypothetical protein